MDIALLDSKELYNIDVSEARLKAWSDFHISKISGCILKAHFKGIHLCEYEITLLFNGDKTNEIYLNHLVNFLASKNYKTVPTRKLSNNVVQYDLRITW